MRARIRSSIVRPGIGEEPLTETFVEHSKFVGSQIVVDLAMEEIDRARAATPGLIDEEDEIRIVIAFVS